jgi:hypothetical protein
MRRTWYSSGDFHLDFRAPGRGPGEPVSMHRGNSSKCTITGSPANQLIRYLCCSFLSLFGCISGAEFVE